MPFARFGARRRVPVRQSDRPTVRRFVGTDAHAAPDVHDRGSARHPRDAPGIGDVVAARCLADARFPLRARSMVVDAPWERVPAVRPSRRAARRRPGRAARLGDARRQPPARRWAAPPPGHAQQRPVGGRLRRLPAAAPDGRVERGRAAARSPASSRLVHGARGTLPASGRGESGAIALPRARGRACDGSGRVPASPLRRERSSGADLAPLAGRDAHHIRRTHRRCIHSDRPARGFLVQRTRAGRRSHRFRLRWASARLVQRAGHREPGTALELLGVVCVLEEPGGAAPGRIIAPVRRVRAHDAAVRPGRAAGERADLGREQPDRLGTGGEQHRAGIEPRS